MDTSRIMMVIMIFWSAIFGCVAEGESVSIGAVQREINMTEATAKPAWEMEWDKVLTDARKEGHVVVLTTMTASIKSDLMQEMKKYGIQAEFVVTSGSEMSRKIAAEYSAGIHSYDVLSHGSSTYFELLASGNIPFAPMSSILLLPEIVQPTNWLGNNLWYLDKQRRYFIAFAGVSSWPIVYNTAMVGGGEINTWKDLLDPKWKGKISMGDPTIAGTSQNYVQTMASLYGIEFLKSLAKQEPFLSRNERLLVEWVARGKYPVTFAVNLAAILDFQTAGAPIASLIPPIGVVTTNPANLAVLKDAPHPNAARAFANVLLTKEIQTRYAKLQGMQSFRVGVPADHLGEVRKIPQRDNYILITDEEHQKGREGGVKIAKEIFGPLLK